MPVRSLTSSVLTWPDARAVMAAARALAARWEATRPELVRLGVFGSYARGDAVVGSDLDLIAIVRDAAPPFERRAVEWDLTSLPVPAEVTVYTEAEWRRLGLEGGRFHRMISEQAVWLVQRAESARSVSRRRRVGGGHRPASA